MKQSIPITLVMMGALLGGGCATKKFVRQTVDPVSGKLETVAQQSNQQGEKLNQTGEKLNQTASSLDDTRKSLSQDETELSATKERAMTADNKAGEAMTQANSANQKADKLTGDLTELRSTVANLDDYKQVNQAIVNFKFNSDKLNADSKQQLDQMVASQNQYKRFFIAVEGYTDSIGPVDYNAALSRRRADAVVEYLVAQHNIPIYRVHMVGLGKEKPVDEARTSAARAKNRRVEVSLFSADQGSMAMSRGNADAGARSSQPGNNNSRPGNQTQQQ
jgi:outer membrane protein OmpA-like peptidoglycan-associated protein